MNVYDPGTVFSSIDHAGRYAYGNQPAIAQWNLVRFAEALLPLLDADSEQAVALAVEALGEFPARFEGCWLAGMRKKLGLDRAEPGDPELIQSLLNWMHRSRADFTNTFYDLSSELPQDEKYQDPKFQAWQARWRLRQSREGRPHVLPRR